MPELPEVETMVRGVGPSVTGMMIRKVRFCRISCKPVLVAPSRSAFSRRVAGRKIDKVARLAKRVVISLNSGDHIVIEPRMTGLVLLSDPPTQEHLRLRLELGSPDCRTGGGHPRTALTQKGVGELRFWDRRGLGTVSVLSCDQLSQLKERLGTDALAMSEDDWQTCLQKTKREIKPVLLDQSLVGGIGNLYASEILHLARIAPTRCCDRIGTRMVQRLNAATKTILEEAIKYEGSTLADGTYRNALNQTGSYQNEHRVYGKEGTRCRACNRGTIRRIVQAQRATFFCPACQK